MSRLAAWLRTMADAVEALGDVDALRGEVREFREYAKNIDAQQGNDGSELRLLRESLAALRDRMETAEAAQRAGVSDLLRDRLRAAEIVAAHAKHDRDAMHVRLDGLAQRIEERDGVVAQLMARIDALGDHPIQAAVDDYAARLESAIGRYEFAPIRARLDALEAARIEALAVPSDEAIREAVARSEAERLDSVDEREEGAEVPSGLERVEGEALRVAMGDLLRAEQGAPATVASRTREKRQAWLKRGWALRSEIDRAMDEARGGWA